MDSPENRTIPICFTPLQLRLLEEYARIKGVLNLSQVVEDLIEKNETH
jgi:hypothetical protein